MVNNQRQSCLKKQQNTATESFKVCVPPGVIRKSYLIPWLPWWLSDGEYACQCGRCRVNPWVKKVPGVGNSNPLQYCCWENPTDRGAWWVTVDGVAKGQTWLRAHMLCSIVYMNHIFFIHSSANGYLGCFLVLALWIVLLWIYKHMYLSEL